LIVGRIAGSRLYIALQLAYLFGELLFLTGYLGNSLGICSGILSNLVGLVRQLTLLVVDLLRALLGLSQLLLQAATLVVVGIGSIVQQAVDLLHGVDRLLLGLLLSLGIPALFCLTQVLGGVLQIARSVRQLRIILLGGLFLQLAREFFKIAAQLLDITLIGSLVLILILSLLALQFLLGSARQVGKPILRFLVLVAALRLGLTALDRFVLVLVLVQF
jgi:hypothetical protein